MKPRPEEVDKFITDIADFINEYSKEIERRVIEFHNSHCEDNKPNCVSMFKYMTMLAIEQELRVRKAQRRRMN